MKKYVVEYWIRCDNVFDNEAEAKKHHEYLVANPKEDRKDVRFIELTEVQ